MSEALIEDLQRTARDRVRRCQQSLVAIEKRAEELQAEIAEAQRIIEFLGTLQPMASERPKTKTAAILEIIERNPSGLSNSELLAQMKALFEKVNPKSLDTLLWRLKNEGKIRGGKGQPYRLVE